MIFYITFKDLYSTGYAGIRKKVIAQTKALENKLGKLCVAFWCNQMAFLMQEENVIEKRVAVTRKEYGNVLLSWIEKYNVDRTYVRYPLSDKFFLEFLKFQKEKGIRTVLEIPTYPYDAELPFGRLKGEDAYYREMVGEYVDVISTYSNDSEIWGKRCIRLVNGVDVEKIPFFHEKKENNKIILVAVGCMEPWHGFERILEGMGNYYHAGGKRQVYFRLVGEGVELNRYRREAECLEVQDYVEILGQKEGEDLTKCFYDTDIAIGSLGYYKNGIREGSPIKGAEYCARGLPMVLGYDDMRFPEKTPFVFRVPNDSSAIPIDDIIKFYDHIAAQENYREKIRSYAVKYLSWDTVMEPVAEYFRERS